MKAIRLITFADDVTGETGLVLKDCKQFEGLMADRDGTLTAHDVLEHQNGVAGMGPVWDELEALGGVWYVRGQWGDFMTGRPSYHSPEANLASDVTRMFSDYSCDPDTGPGGLSTGSRPHDHDESFREIVAIARRDIPREFNDMGRGDPDEDENGWSPELHEVFEEYLTLALHRMRAGYRKAQRRFERDGASRFYAGNLFCAIRDAVKSAAREIDWEGQEFILRYGNGEATCRPVYDDGEAY